MNATIEPGIIHGTITAPPSKSLTQRALAGALLHRGNTNIVNAGDSEDERAALEVIRQLGAKVDMRLVKGVPHLRISGDCVAPVSTVINCKESGLAARLFTPIAALSAQPIKIEGEGTLRQRPLAGVAEVFSQLGVTLEGFNGMVPFKVTGPIKQHSVKMDAADSSQLLSGLLFALSSCATAPLTIEVSNLNSRPYIDMTIDMLERFGKPVVNEDYKKFHIDPAKFVSIPEVTIDIEGDWSGAAPLLIAGAIAGEVMINNLNMASKQADKAVLDILRESGAEVAVAGNSVNVKRANLRAFEFDATQCPDLFPVLAVLAACCKGESYIRGVHRLFHKESNRAESISEMLMNFDVPFSMEDDVLCVTGVRKLQGTVIDSYNDHRIVMAAAIGALRAGSRVDIRHAEAVRKSYSRFFEDLILCGGKCIFDE